MTPFWYLASPHADPDPHVRDKRFHVVAAVAARLARLGIKLFCPITHSHPLECYKDFELPEEERHRFWLDLDQPLMEASCGLIVVMMAGWTESKGIEEELAYFKEAGKPIMYLEVDGQSNL